MASRRATQAGAQLIAGVLVVGLVLLILKWALITVAILIVPFGIWWIWDRNRSRGTVKAAQARHLAAQRPRDELEARATVDAAGGCGWCGSRIAHRGESGGLIYPLDYHRSEIEEQLATEPSR